MSQTTERNLRKGHMEDTQKTPDQLELEQAQERLGAAKRRIADAEAMRLRAAQVAIAEREVATQKAISDERERQRLIEEKWARAKADKTAAEERERQAQLAVDRRLEAEFNAQQEKIRLAEQRDKELKRLSEESFMLESEARRLENEAIAQRSVLADESNTSDAVDESNGLTEGPSGLEAADPANWGTPALRRILHR